MLRVIKLGLDRYGFAVDTALSGDLALVKLKSAGKSAGKTRFADSYCKSGHCCFDALIVDADMPGMNGMQFSEFVYREFPENPPLIFIVARASDQCVGGWAARYPGIEFLEKPMSLRWLVSRLNDNFDDSNSRLAVGSWSDSHCL